MIIIAIAIVVLIVIGGLSYWMFFTDKEEDTPATTEEEPKEEPKEEPEENNCNIGEELDESSKSCERKFYRGRYVKVTSSQNGIALNFAELEVYDKDGNNVALNKTATQSSIGWNDKESVGPQNAIDGNTKSLMHTSDDETDGFHWWQVDLGSEKDITKIKLQRRDECCQPRENEAKIQILANDGTTVVHEFTTKIVEQILGQFPPIEEYNFSKGTETFKNLLNYDDLMGYDYMVFSV